MAKTWQEEARTWTEAFGYCHFWLQRWEHDDAANIIAISDDLNFLCSLLERLMPLAEGEAFIRPGGGTYGVLAELYIDPFPDPIQLCGAREFSLTGTTLETADGEGTPSRYSVRACHG